MYEQKTTQLVNKFKQLKSTCANLNQQINDRNNDITKLNATVSTQEAQIASLNQQKEMAEEQAKKVPDLTKKVEQYEEYQITWRENEAKYLKKITDLTNQSAGALTIPEIIGLLLKKIGRR